MFLFFFADNSRFKIREENFDLESDESVTNAIKNGHRVFFLFFNLELKRNPLSNDEILNIASGTLRSLIEQGLKKKDYILLKSGAKDYLLILINRNIPGTRRIASQIASRLRNLSLNIYFGFEELNESNFSETIQLGQSALLASKATGVSSISCWQHDKISTTLI